METEKNNKRDLWNPFYWVKKQDWQGLSKTDQKKEREEPNSYVWKRKRDFITHITETQRIIKEYFEKLYLKKLENLKEISKLLGTYNLPKLKQENIKNQNRSIMSKDIEALIQNHSKRKIKDLVDSLLHSVRHWKKS
jgi:flagellar motor component MotA